MKRSKTTPVSTTVVPTLYSGPVSEIEVVDFQEQQDKSGIRMLENLKMALLFSRVQLTTNQSERLDFQVE